MACRCGFVGMIVVMAFVAGGCATTAREPPPEVAPQPREITTREAVVEGERSAAQPAVPIAPAPTAATAPAVATAPAAVLAQRFRPTTRSTREIREQSARAPRPLDFGQRLDHAHDRLYVWGQKFVEAADRGLAATDQPLHPVPAAPFRLGTALEVFDRADGPHAQLDLKFDINLSLPNTEQRLGIFITSAELDSGVRDSSQRSALRAGVRYELLRHLDFDAGVRIDLPPVVFAAVKWSREYRLGSWDFYPLAKLFAETEESVGFATGITFDRWSGRQLLRSSTYAKWRHDRGATEWSETLVFARASELIVPERYGSYISADDIGRGWGVRVQTSGATTRQVSRHEAGLFYRGRTPNRWLYWFVEPLVRWDRAWQWSADPGVRIGFDALFWDLAR